MEGRSPSDGSASHEVSRAFEAVVRPDVEEYVAAQYLGRRAALRPVFDAVRAAALALGPDVRMEGRPAYVRFVRAREFAAVAVTVMKTQTATKSHSQSHSQSHVDLGLRLPAPPPTRRLTAATAPGRSTHRLVLVRPADVDGEVRALLRAAYDQNG